jgi:hypothetical protein
MPVSFKRTYKQRTDLVKTAVDSATAGDREGQIKAIQGGLFVVER